MVNDRGCAEMPALSAGEQVREAARVVAAQCRALPHLTAALVAARRSSDVDRIDLEKAPESALCAEAEVLATRAYTPAVLNHALRCWHWATLLARHEGYRYDSKALYIACLLHDVGLGGELGFESACFTSAGARAGADLLAEHDDVDRAAVIVDAIVGHFSARVRDGAGIESVLLHDAAFLDVAGLGIERTTMSDRVTVISELPRTTFAREFAAALKYESHARPRSRAAVSYRVGAPLALRLNPLEHL